MVAEGTEARIALAAANIYRSCGASGAWTAWCESLRALTRSDMACLVVSTEATGQIAATGVGFGAGTDDAYTRYYHRLDPARRRIASMPRGSVAALYDATDQRFRSSEFYAQYYSRLGIAETAHLVVATGREMVIASISVGHGRVSEEQLYLFGAIHADLDRAVALAGRLQQAESSGTKLGAASEQVCTTLRRSPGEPMPTRSKAATISTARLRSKFDLTPAEANIALRLVDGTTAPEIARELSVQQNTVRAHLKSIFSKTSTHSQIELVNRLLRNGAEPQQDR